MHGDTLTIDKCGKT